MIRIVIVEDQFTHQDYLTSLIEKESDMECIEVIDNAKEAIVRIPSLNPDVVLVDLGLPDVKDGLSCIKALSQQCEGLKIIVLTIYQEDEYIFDALRSGARGYVLKKSKPYQVIDAIRDIYNGAAPISGEIALKILNKIPELQHPGTNQEAGLTKREKEILSYLSKGYTHLEMSNILYISVNTIKTHVYNIYCKLGVNNKTEALMKYYRR